MGNEPLRISQFTTADITSFNDSSTLTILNASAPTDDLKNQNLVFSDLYTLLSTRLFPISLSAISDAVVITPGTVTSITSLTYNKYGQITSISGGTPNTPSIVPGFSYSFGESFTGSNIQSFTSKYTGSISVMFNGLYTPSALSRTAGGINYVPMTVSVSSNVRTTKVNIGTIYCPVYRPDIAYGSPGNVTSFNGSILFTTSAGETNFAFTFGSGLSNVQIANVSGNLIAINTSQ